VVLPGQLANVARLKIYKNLYKKYHDDRKYIGREGGPQYNNFEEIKLIGKVILTDDPTIFFIFFQNYNNFEEIKLIGKVIPVNMTLQFFLFSFKIIIF
jgi:hypothetical protein